MYPLPFRSIVMVTGGGGEYGGYNSIIKCEDHVPSQTAPNCPKAWIVQDCLYGIMHSKEPFRSFDKSRAYCAHVFVHI